MNFNDIFHKEQKWKEIKLIDKNPCKNCKIYNDYEYMSLLGNIAERQYAELPDTCNHCVPKLQWILDCLNKLSWYEEREDELNELYRN